MILKNISLFDSNTFALTKVHLLIHSDENGRYHPIEERDFPAGVEVLNCEGQMAMKAFANGHHHAYSTLARGMPFPENPPRDFVEILEKIWWNLDKNLTSEMNEISAYYTAIASAKNGVSAVIDHHSSPFAIHHSLETMYNAIQKVGLDSVLCYEISDRDGELIRDKALEETEEYLRNHLGLVGLHASFTLNDDTLQKAASLALETNSGVHIHLAEAEADQIDSINKYHKRVVERLSDFGFLTIPKSIFAHGLYLSSKEKEMIASSPVYVVQNPESNLNNKVGYFNGKEMGNHIMLGTDGMHSNMIRSAQTAYFTGQNFEDIDMQAIYTRLRNVNRYLETHFGDNGNDLLIMDMDTPTPIHQNNYLGHFFFGFENRHIRHLIKNGNFIMRDKKLQNVDEEIIKKEAQKLALYLWKKL